MMKKILALLLCTVVAFGLVSCSDSGEGPSEIEHGPYSQVWTAQDEVVEHEVGGLAVDNGWGSISDEDPGALCRVTTDTLYNTAYTAAARLLVNEKSTKNTAVAAVLRVLDEDGNELGRQNVRVCDFADKLTYQDVTFTFDAGKTTTATFEIYWPGSAYVRVSEFGIMSKTKDSLPNFYEIGKAILGTEIVEETEIVYDENTLYYFDLYEYMSTVSNAEEAYDIANIVCTLQGLVNRDAQRLFIRFVQPNGFSSNTDGYWLDYLRQEGGFLADKTLVTVKSPATLLKIFSNYYNGFAAWDPTVPATVNAVATACGVENLLPVRYSTVSNSLYYYVKNAEEFLDKAVEINLGGKFTGKGTIYGTDVQSTGSRKNDAYIWAKERYLDTHKVNSHLMAYHVDAYASDTVFAQYNDLQNMFLSNRDYYIANKAFFFDLSPMQFEIPDDDPDQEYYDIGDEGTIDFSTFCAIMGAQSKYAEEVDSATPIDVGGFTPWHLKYTRYTNESASGEVTCEWETVYQFSIYNAYINADAPSYTAMANASIYMNFPMKESYTHTASKEIKGTLPTASERGVNYIMFYMGDFDASAWLNTAMIKLWNDEKRGEIPLCWTFALNLSKRAGHVIDWMYSTATENDYFVAGDNGVGYLNPESFANERSKEYYGDLDSWANYNKPIFEKYDIDYQGFLITRRAASSEILECYAKFCKGAAVNTPTTATAEGLTIVQSTDYLSTNQILQRLSKKEVGSASSFMNIRFILRTPTDVYRVYSELTSEANKEYNVKVVDPYTFYGLLAQQNNG